MRGFTVSNARGQKVYEWDNTPPAVTVAGMIRYPAMMVIAFLIGILIAGGM